MKEIQASKICTQIHPSETFTQIQAGKTCTQIQETSIQRIVIDKHCSLTD
jgi:hypothetical protein